MTFTTVHGQAKINNNGTVQRRLFRSAFEGNKNEQEIGNGSMNRGITNLQFLSVVNMHDEGGRSENAPRLPREEAYI